MKRNHFSVPVRAHRQSGAALVVVLMLLIVITLLGLASMRGVIMQERMTASTVARGMAFQAAEAGLRQAEITVRDGSISFPASGCTSGLCALPVAGAAPIWEASGFWSSGNVRDGAPVGTGDLAITPRFIIEEFGTSVNGGGVSDSIDMSKAVPTTTEQGVYRITAYAATANGAEVVVQSLYHR